MRTRLIAIVGLTLALFAAFQNCSSGSLPDTSTETSSATPAGLVAGLLTVIPANQQVTVGASATFSVTPGNVSTVSYVCSTPAGAQVSSATLSQGPQNVSVTAPGPMTCVFTGSGPNVLSTPVRVQVTTAAPAPAPTPTPAPAPTPPPPPPPVCGNEDVHVGSGGAASPRVWKVDTCGQSCRGTFGNDSICKSDCWIGERDFHYCNNCTKVQWVCH